jgi:hypothetical protein
MMTMITSCSHLFAPFGLTTKMRYNKLQQYSNNQAMTSVNAGQRGRGSVLGLHGGTGMLTSSAANVSLSEPIE